MTTDLRVNDPTCSYAAFKLAFHQHYGVGSLTHKLNWANSFHQRTNEQTSEYFARSSAELANHLKESSQELFGKEYVYADITDPFVHFQAAIEGEIVANMLTLDSFTRQLRAALAGANAAMKAHDFTRVKNYQTNVHTSLNSQAIFQKLSKNLQGHLPRSNWVSEGMKSTPSAAQCY